ncbi:hypothetical protein H6P87_01048 [Rickettsia tillamookensis]|uniref:Uncharacterized protein n=2 Tax=spotted fever group TaxID=114277 RepID=A0A9E6MIS1_9RICK|nr:hypothetical protein [Rickettsia tillamookensis]QQV75488.1 hypothetical protein H6P87_01048 [Rickettsia tillamookensis]
MGKEFKKSIVLIIFAEVILARFAAINIVLVTSNFQRNGTTALNL